MNNAPVQNLVQSYLLPSLEATARRLELLNESQQKLLHQLTTIEAALEEVSSLTFNLDKKDVIAKIAATKKRMSVVSASLNSTQLRINKIQQSLDLRADSPC